MGRPSAMADTDRFDRHTRSLLNTAGGGREPIVYYASFGHLIKIGSSLYPDLRMKHLRASLLVTEHGGRRREGERLLQFGSCRVPGEMELFFRRPTLIAHIAELLVAEHERTAAGPRVRCFTCGDGGAPKVCERWCWNLRAKRAAA